MLQPDAQFAIMRVSPRIYVYCIHRSASGIFICEIEVPLKAGRHELQGAGEKIFVCKNAGVEHKEAVCSWSGNRFATQ